MASDYFGGGTPPVTFALVNRLEADNEAPTDANDMDPLTLAFRTDSVFKVALADGVLTITKRPASETPVVLDTETDTTVQAHYVAGTQFMLKATDANGATDTTGLISVIRNRAPGATAEEHSPTGADALIVGTQMAYATAATAADKAKACEQLDTLCTPILATFFENVDGNKLTYSAVVATASAGFVSVAVDGANLVVTGIKGGVNATTEAPEPKAVKLEVKATDDGGLTSSIPKVVALMVDPQPLVAHPEFNAVQIAPLAQAGAVLTADEYRGIFEDNDSPGTNVDEDLTFAVKLKVARDSFYLGLSGTAGDDGFYPLTDAALNATAKATPAGSPVTIILRATDSIRQWATHEIAVTVKAP